MPQETYQRILLERTHSRHRWENEIADVTIDELDVQEIRRTIQTSIASGRLPADTSADDLTDVLDRLGLRVRGSLVNAAVVAFSRAFAILEGQAIRFRVPLLQTVKPGTEVVAHLLSPFGSFSIK